MSGELVLVTGGTGFVAAHCIAALLQRGYRVRTSIRSLTRETDVHHMLREAGVLPGEPLSFVEADLTTDAGWPEAVAGCDFVLHVASPFPASVPKNEDDLIIPARDGALRVLRAARDAGVKRVVLTSSFAAIGYGHPPTDRPFTESTWTDIDGRDVGPYAKSKTLAERAAWDFIATEASAAGSPASGSPASGSTAAGGTALELAVVNPVGILGPALGPSLSTSMELLRALLSGATPMLPRISMSFVDVRDVADLHLRAMIDPAAAGERFLAAAGDPMALPDVASLLKERMGLAAARVPTRVLPDWAVRPLAVFNPALREVLPRLGPPKHVSNVKATHLLGWAPRSSEEAILAAAESLVELGLLPERGGRTAGRASGGN